MALALPLWRSAATFLLIAFQFPVCAQAGNWDLEPSLSQRGSWESNALMLKQDPIELYGSTTSVRLDASSTIPTAAISLGNTLSQTLFNKAAFNSTDFHNRTKISKRNAQWEAMLGLSGDYDTTRTSEITGFGTNALSVRHWAYGTTPELSWQIDATNQVSVNAAVSASRYDSASYTNYNIYSAATTWHRALSADTSALLSATARRYQTQNNTDETVDSFGPTIGFAMTLTPRLVTRLMAGLEASKQDRASIASPSWEWSSVYSASLTFKGEQDSLTLTSSRSQQPYGNGTSSLLTSFSAQEKHALNKLFSFVVSGDYATAQQSGLSASTLKNKMSGKAGFVYHALEDVDVDASYRYREESYYTNSDKAKDNAVLITFSYRPLTSGAP